jgi:hypothetical protein
MTKKTKFYDIIPQEKKSIRNIPIPEKGGDEDEGSIESNELHHGVEMARKNKHKSQGGIKKHNHQESSSVEIKKLERPITNVEDYDEDEYIEIIDHKTSDDETVEEVHILGENRDEIEKNKIPALAETEEADFSDYTKVGKGGGGFAMFRGFFRGSYKLPITIFIVLAACFFALTLFSSAKVILKVKDLSVSLDSGYVFDKGDGEIIQSTSTDSIEVPANGTVRVDKKSTGTVVIFNNTSSSQKLSKDTRIQTPSGLIYFIDKAVTVPAKKTVAKKTVLGSVTITFTAQAVGEKYNSGPKDFTLVGFKGTSKFETIYGRSKGSITGGYSGEVPNISQKDLSSQIADSKEEMKETLFTLLKKQADSMGLIINSETLQYKIINSETRLSADKTKAVVTVDGTLQAATFLNASVDEAAKGILGATDTNGLKYEVDLASSTIETTASSEDDQITAKGNVQVKISINEGDLKKALENKTKKDALTILQQSKGVTYAQIKLSPFWKTALPKAEGITLLVQD